MSILDKLVAATSERVEREKRTGLPSQSAERRSPFAFEQRLGRLGMSYICEIKKASPTQGVITEDFSCPSIAREYEDAGADCISVLTEPQYFLGDNRYLTEIRRLVDCPLLRKDFIIDSFQIEQSALLGADAMLLICSILTHTQLVEFLRIAETYGLSCLVEIQDESELTTALRSGARVIGVNNRNLRTFKVDIRKSIGLRRLVPDEVVFVSESGIKSHADINLLRKHNVDAVLIGESLMRSSDRRAALAMLRGDVS